MLMAHLVAGYPTQKIAKEVATSLVEGGADILEVQLPFSDPQADGPAIQKACSTVLKNGYTTQKGLDFISDLHATFREKTIYIMSYASLVWTPGINNFVKKAKAAGVAGLIVPDLPFDMDEGLEKACLEEGLYQIPVASPSMAEERLAKMINHGFKYIYAALRIGITGTQTTIDDSTKEFLKKVSSGKSKVYGGFGISTGLQAAKVAPLVEAVVAGSVFTRLIDKYQNDITTLKQKLKEKSIELSGTSI